MRGVESSVGFGSVSQAGNMSKVKSKRKRNGTDKPLSLTLPEITYPAIIVHPVSANSFYSFSTV